MSAGPEDSNPQQTPHRRSGDQGERRAHNRKEHQDTGTPRYLDPGDTVFSLWGRVIMARYRRIAAAATRHIIQRPLHIGVSARIFHPEPGATGLRSKNLQYLEESIAQWVMSRDVLVFMIPTVNTEGLLHPSARNGAATARATCTSWSCCTNLSRLVSRCWASAVAAS
jgi:putative glutamine amidotransferase